MTNINDSKKIIIICGFLILISLVIIFIIKKSDKLEDYYFYDDSSTVIKDYKINEVIPIYVNTEQVAKKYLAEYVNFMLYYPEKAYELLDEDYKNANFENIDDFKKYIKSIKSLKLERAEVTKYTYDIYNNKNTYYVIDSSDNKFKFIENSLMDYSVIIN